MSINYIILEGVIDLTEEEDGSCEEALIAESRIYLESLMNWKNRGGLIQIMLMYA